MLNSSFGMIMEKICPFMTLAEQINGHNFKFEFSCPRIHQRIGKVERKIQTFYESVRSTLNTGGLEDSVRTGVRADCARTTTFHSNITSIKANDECPYQLMLGSKSKIPTSLSIFVEMGLVTTKDDIQGKSNNCGLTCMLGEYSVDHANDFHWMLNLNFKSIIQTRSCLARKMLRLLA
jgi:hypothetical protein